VLTYDNVRTIRNAILKRLDQEKRVKVCDIEIDQIAEQYKKSQRRRAQTATTQ
jgi:hypothetical protein